MKPGLYVGDARELTQKIPDESIDLILTDPPYDKEHIWTYEWTARLGERVLKPGSYLFIYNGSMYLPEVLKGMCKSNLNYHWQFVLLHRGGYPRMWHKRLFCGYKSILIFTKGKPAVRKWMSTVHSDEQDKRYHKWGQGTGFGIKMIDMLTEPGDLILDPFCGGGTTASICKMLNRQCITFEIDPDTAEIARQRITHTQPPLFDNT